MRKRTRMLIVVLVLALMAFMLFPTIQWYFFWDEDMRQEASYTTQTIKNEAAEFAKEGYKVFNLMYEEDPQSPMDLSKADVNKSIEYVPDKIREKAFNAIYDEVVRIYKERGKKVPDEISYDLAKGAFVAVDESVTKKDLEKYAELNIKEFLESYRREELFKLKDRSERIIQLGLDLAGGVSYTLEADIDSFAKAQTLAAREEAVEKAIEKLIEEGVDEEEARSRQFEESDLEYTQYDLSDSKSVDQVMQQALEQISDRVNIYGASEPVIRRIGTNWIQVDLPGAKDPERLKRLLLGRGSLNFHLVDNAMTSRVNEWIVENEDDPSLRAALDSYVDGGQLKLPAKSGLLPGYIVVGTYEKDMYREDKRTGWLVIKEEPGMKGSRVESANVIQKDESGAVATAFNLYKEGTEDFARMTKGATEDNPVTIAVVMDGKAKMVASASEQLLSARLNVSGRGINYREAEDFAKLLELGSREVPIEILSSDVIGSGLGEDYINKGVNALFWAMVLVVGFMLVWYLGGGLVADIALVMNVFIMAGILSQIQLTLTLAGMAGLILTVGMSVDANVIIFERIKEEARLGKSAASALRAGFQKAFWTILDANITTFIAAVVLSYFGSGTVKGFAMILAVGIFSSMFTALFVARLFLDIGVETFKVKRLLISWRK